MSDFDEHTRMWADEIVDGCYHDSHMYVGEGLWRCDQCGEVIRYIDDPNGNITLTELHPYKNRKVRTEVVTPGNRPGNREWWTPRLPSSGRSCYVIGHNFTPQPGCSTLCVCGDWDHHPVHGQEAARGAMPFVRLAPPKQADAPAPPSSTPKPSCWDLSSS